MQRIIPFGVGYAQSAEFSVDEGQTIRFWLVREDYTTTPGHHAFAELQIKSAVGNDRWTTLHEMTGDEAYYDLIGVDESLTYRWVRKDAVPSIAIDRAQDGAMSRTQATSPGFVPAPGTLAADDTEPVDTCSRLKLVFAADPLLPTTIGVRATFPAADPTDFGAVSSADLHGLFDPAQAGVFSLLHDTLTGSTTLHVERTGSPSLTAFDGATVNLLHPSAAVADTFVIDAADTTATVIDKVVAGFAPFVADTSLWVVVCPASVAYAPPPAISNSGRFILDQNDIPARLTATGFDPAAPFEEVRLYAIEDGVVIPMTYDEDGDPIRLVSTFRGFTIIAPGEYEWRRTDYSNLSVFLNTGWRA